MSITITVRKSDDLDRGHGMNCVERALYRAAVMRFDDVNDVSVTSASAIISFSERELCHEFSAKVQKLVQDSIYGQVKLPIKLKLGKWVETKGEKS